MDMAKPLSTPSNIVAELDELAGDYHHNPIQHIILNPYKNSILVFRAKYATYETITSTLNDKGVKVSEATVRKFCRTHQQEVKRLRAEFDRKRRETESRPETRAVSPDPAETAATSEASRTPSTSETARPGILGKPGPKIARENL
jgi:hypothetical protein